MVPTIVYEGSKKKLDLGWNRIDSIKDGKIVYHNDLGIIKSERSEKDTEYTPKADHGKTIPL